MILQTTIPYDVMNPRPLPGISPLGTDPWFLIDEVYAKQMSLRRDLLEQSPNDVLATAQPSEAAQQDMLDEILGHLPVGFDVSPDDVTCPDRYRVAIDRDKPFLTLGNVLQDDICLLEKRGDEYVLTGAVLCFPASWSLAEKIGHPLTHIHEPVADYTDDLARRVNRLFDGVRAEKAIWRFNALWYEDPTLHQPRSEIAPRPITQKGQTPYLRSERQVIWRLPKSNAVLFTIHTFVLPHGAIVTAESAV